MGTSLEILRCFLPSQSYPVPMSNDALEGRSRIQAARRRAQAAKLGLAMAGVAVFGVGMTLARGNVAGHSRSPLRPLAAPRRFQAVVRQDAIAGGLLAPAQASPGAATSQS
jgi:hypothetical protein